MEEWVLEERDKKSYFLILEKKMVRKNILLLVVGIFLISFVSAVCPSSMPNGMIFCEDFEDQNYYDTFGTGADNCANLGRHCISNEEESSYYMRGNWYEPGTDSVCNEIGENNPRMNAGVGQYCEGGSGSYVPMDFSTSYSSGEFWIKFRAKFPSTGGSRYHNSGGWDEIKIFNIDGLSSGDNYIQATFLGYINSYGAQWGSQWHGNGYGFEDGGWHTWLLKWEDAGSVTLWIDDVQIMSRSLSGGKFRRWAYGYAHNTIIADSAWMMDDVEIWDRIPDSQPFVCQNGVCESGEDCLSCPQDCVADNDGDTYDSTACGGTDCNDNNVNIYPGAIEVCDLVDNNCIGGIDENNGDCSGLMPYCVSGACVECIDDIDCSGSDTCVNYFCTTPSDTIVSVDSTYSGYSTSVIDDEVIIADGGTATTWASASNSTQPHWVAINFSQSRDINNVTIYWAYNNQQSMLMSSQEVQVQYWDGSQYLTAATITNSGAVEVSSATFSTINTASLRLYQPANMGPLTYSTVIWLTEVDYSLGAISQCSSAADSDFSDDVSIIELINYIGDWKAGSVLMTELMTAIGEWKNGC